jgi:hypothetical protein
MSVTSLLRIAVLVPTSFELARAEYSIMANKVYLTADEYAMYRAGYVYGYYIISFGCTSAGDRHPLET